MTGGELAQFLMYSMFVGSSAAALSEVWGEVQRGAGAMERLAELLVATPVIRAPANPMVLPGRASGRIAFKNIRFHYPSRPDTQALEDFSLEIGAVRQSPSSDRQAPARAPVSSVAAFL